MQSRYVLLLAFAAFGCSDESDQITGIDAAEARASGRTFIQRERLGNPLVSEVMIVKAHHHEHNRGTPGRAVGFLEANDEARLYLPFVVAGELASGTSLADRSRWEAFLAPFYLLGATPEVCWEYGRAFRYLHENGRLIGGNDLWIAATALANRMPVVTANIEHFRRVPGLEVINY